MKRTPEFLLAAAAIFAVVISGCSQQSTQRADNDINHDVVVANQKVNQAVQDAKPKLNALDLGARVTAALQASQNLPHGAIRVDASPTGVRLRGSVANDHQKRLATQIAKDTLGPGKTVDDELTVKHV